VKQIEELLQRAIGLDVASIGPTAVSRAVRARMRRHRLERAAEYLDLLSGNSTELAELIESVVVVETYFFRHQESFQALARLAREWQKIHAGETMQILSAPCATGEEPYSIVMALLDAGIAPARFHVDAIDISARALACAERGIYGANSFRGNDLEFRSRHFHAHRQGHEINPNVRQQVSFRLGNLMEPGFPLSAKAYHFIFCRNILIYLDDSTRRAVLSRLRQHLSPDGIVFLGPAEMPLALANGFVAGDTPHTFGCRPALPAHSGGAKHAPENRDGSPSLTVPRLAAQIVQSTALEHARQLAEAGRLDEAIAICETSLREHGASAEAYYVLGLARFSAGASTQAAEFYRRALYLEPNHYDTLTQWAALLKRNGDRDRSRRLSLRAERLKRAN
jgi:chemotaxis protein methyltransferase WspC